MTTHELSVAVRGAVMAALEELETRVYLGAAPASAPLPLAVVRIDQDAAEPYLTGDRRSVRLSIHLHWPASTGMAAAADGADRLFLALHRQPLGDGIDELVCLDRGQPVPARRSIRGTSRWRLGSDEA